MKTVTQILEFTKSRYKIYIENEFAFVLYKGELRLYNIVEGQEIAEEDYLAILTQVLPKRAKLRAMHLLQKRDYTQRQLYDKLKQQFYPQQIIEEAIEYVKGYNYINDIRYVQDFIIYNLPNKSRRRIEEDLAKKGIERSIIEEEFAAIGQEDIRQAELDKINSLLCKKHYTPEDISYEEEQKLTAFLMRKGFDLSLIHDAMNNYPYT